jgi:hypothetical protein
MKSVYAGHLEGGLQYEFDVTDVVKQAADRGRIDRGELSVTLRSVSF